MLASAGKALLIVENNSVPFDRRVWREAQTLRDGGWHVSVICPRSQNDDRLMSAKSGEGDFEVLEGIHIYRFPLAFARAGVLSYAREYITALLHILKLSWHVLHREGFDVVQVCNPPDLFFALGAFYRLMGKGFIFDHHDLFPESIHFRYHGLVGWLAHSLALLTERLTFKAADVVIATNQSYRRIAMKRGSVSPDRVFVVRNGPDLDHFRPVSPDPILRQGFAYIACYLGVMGVEDGVEPMVEAARHVICELGRSDILFVLIGDGSHRQWGIDRVKERGLESQVKFTGRLPEDQVKAYLSTCDICLSPDPYTPLNNLSTMNKVMEYMAMGKPLVSFELEEARFSGGDAAVYVKSGSIEAFGKAIVDLIDDPERRKQMGESGMRRVQSELAWNFQKPILMEAYSSALRKVRKLRIREAN